MRDGREYTVVGWCRNRMALGDQNLLKQLLHVICERINMTVLGDIGFDVKVDLSKRNKEIFEDEGGSTAMLCLSTSHIAVHGWPSRDTSRPDGAYFRLSVSSCRDFDPEIVDRTVIEWLGVNTDRYKVVVNAAVESPA